MQKKKKCIQNISFVATEHFGVKYSNDQKFASNLSFVLLDTIEQF